jgi:AraC family transcriptional activator of tynA and feaB
MKTIFSTCDVHPRDRFSYWRDVACAKIVDHDSVTNCPQTFQAEIQLGAVADVDIILYKNSQMVVAHTAAQAARTDDEHLFVCRQVDGDVTVGQEGRRALLKPGSVTILDPRLPYDGTFDAESQMLIMSVPRRLLEDRVGATTPYTACSIDNAAGVTGIASAFMATLPAYSGDLDPTASELIRDQMLDLVALSLPGAKEQRPRLSSSQSMTLMQLRAAIERLLRNPDADATMIAAAAGISVRYANTVLAQEDTSLMRLLIASRLARCRAALEDPAQRHRSISDIAYHWGFSDMTHFGRRFKAAYQALPRDVRPAR